MKRAISPNNKRVTQALQTLCVTAIIMVTITADLLYGQSLRNRTISIYNIHTRETLTVTYKIDGKYVPSALSKINHAMRDHRANSSRIMRKDLIDLMWEVHHQLGSKKPIYLVSGYRSQKTNSAMRKRGGGQAKFSRHILGMAADVHFPDIPVRELRDSTLIRERGGVGYYPTSGLPFVHMDVGRVRHWPRMTRPQLASLFPNGRTRHRPKDGRPITKADAKKYGAAKKRAEMARIQLARRQIIGGAKDTAIASLTPPSTREGKPSLTPIARAELEKKLATLTPLARAELKKKLAALTPLDRAELKKKLAALTPRTQQGIKPKSKTTAWWRGQTIAGLSPSQIKLEEERQFVQLASVDTTMPEQWQSFAPRKKPEVIKQNNVAYSPQFDDEHPEEFNYRPFSLSPLMTDQPLANNQEIAKLSPPDYAESQVLLLDGQVFTPAKFRPGLQFAHLRWANQFSGTSVPGTTP